MSDAAAFTLEERVSALQETVRAQVASWEAAERRADEAGRRAARAVSLLAKCWGCTEATVAAVLKVGE